MKPDPAGLLLRRGGLLIEMACLLALVTLRDERRTFAGIALQPLLIGGVALGFVLWGISIGLMIRDARRSRPSR